MRIDPCLSWRGHKFQPRYSTSNESFKMMVEKATKMEVGPDAIRGMQSQAYEGDICIRCGAWADNLRRAKETR